MSRVLYIMDVGLKTEKMDKVHCVLDKDPLKMVTEPS